MSIRLEGDALAPFLHFMKQYDDFVMNKDVNGIMSLFVEDAEIHSFGLHVNVEGRDKLRQRFEDYFNSDQPFKAEKSDPIVYQFGEAACMCVTLKVCDADAPDVRVSVFMENHAGRWLIRHQHISRSPE